MTATCRYYLLQASNLSAPSKPTQNPPGGNWSKTEPSYTSGSTNTLYFVDLTVYSDGTWAYSSVSKSSAYEAAKEAYNKAQQVADTVDGLTLIQDGKVVIDGGKVYANDAFIQSIFAQDITATGRIKSSNYNGTASNPLSNTAGSILKLDTGAFNFGGGALLYDGSDLTVKGKMRGNAIDIQAVVDASTIGIKTEETSGNVSLVLSASGGTTKGEITLSRGVLKLFGQSLLELATNELYINADTITDANYSKVSYTSFSGGVISSGTINVVKQLGWCQVFGEIKLTGNISDWTQVLTAAQVPAPKHGVNIYPAATQWGTSFIRMPRIQVNGSGGLRLRYGAAATYNFDTTYPI